MEAKWFIFTILSFFLIPNHGFSQDYSARRYTIHEGLAAMQVTCLFQDSRGFLWVGTKVGLSKFNGEAFENFQSEEGMWNGHITDLYEDETGNLLIATRQGLMQYDGATFDTLLSHSNVSFTLLQTDGDTFWISLNNQLAFWDGDTIQHPSPVEQGLKKELKKELSQRSFLFQEITEGLAILTTQNDFLFFPKSFTLKNLGEKIPGDAILKSTLPPRYAAIATANSKLELYDMEAGLEQPILKIEGDTIIRHAPFGQTACFYNEKERAILCVSELNGQSLFWSQKIEALVIEMLFDKEGNLWVGTEEGVFQQFNRAFQNYSSSLLPAIWDVVEDKDENLWFVGYKKGLTKFDGEKYEVIEGYESWLPGGEFYMGAIGSQSGNLFFPTFNSVLKYDGDQFHLIAETNDRYGCSAQILYEDTIRQMLFAGIDKGILAIDLKTDEEFKYWNAQDGLHQNDFILSFEKDREGQYWFGSIYGLSRFDFDQNTFYNYTKQNGNLDAEGIITIFTDATGNIWFGSTSGLWTYHYETDRLVPVATSELNTRIHVLEQLDDHHLLIGAMEGLYILDLKKYRSEGIPEFKIYNRNSGFQGIEPVENGSLKDSKGQIWISCQNHLVKVNGLHLNSKIYPMKALIKSVNDQKVNFIETAPRIDIPYGINEAKINFEAIGMSRPLQTEYAFRLGNQRQWSDWQKENYVQLTGLASGKHIFEIKSRTPGLSEKDFPVDSIILKINLPFWKEPHFYIYSLSAIALLLLLAVFNYWRQRAYRIRALKNERENRYLRVQTLQAQMNPHFVFNVLGTLQNLILGSEPEKANDHLVSLSTMIRRFLDASVKSEMPGRSSLENEISLEEELELIKLYIEFEQLQYEDAFDYQIIVAETLDTATISLPPMIIQPYVENAIRHGLLPKKEKGHLTIRIFESEAALSCEVEDDGIGRDRAKALQKKSLKHFKSRGTNLVKRRIEILNEMGYEIDIRTEDRIEGGTRVLIKLG